MYFKKQRTLEIIDGEKLLKDYTANINLPKKEMGNIISIAVNHMRLCCGNNPSTREKSLWAQCLTEMFPALRDTGNPQNFVSY